MSVGTPLGRLPPCWRRSWMAEAPWRRRTANPEDFTSLMDDLEAKVFDRLPDDTWFYPGHGDDSTLGVERPHLGEWRERGW